MSAAATHATSGLQVRDLTVTYPGRPPVEAVRGVSLEIARGEIVALLGPSGCGKSSLLSAVVGVAPPSAGEIRWDGEDLTRVPVHRRGFGMVFQDGQLFPHRTVAGNVAFGLEMARVPRAERDARVAGLLETVGLAGLGERAVSELSGGQRQRVALARSLAPSPRLLALDEPLSSLDADLRARLGEEVRQILRATGTTGLLVTHDAEEASAIADRVLRMADGRLV
ncbi:ABC transporter ATP-binding protein [Demequina lignilytica]|uniref:ABC transporter ATP-binding protein n=1 Tax=Demequina lignilytica TaxID=3051663 RepID=A0AB35MGJ5_9MICO|nr:ABC transporter ATP-binding protein [Demequina sp. SYSU T0a273]MDN4482924.1 ABC transporter ATP-binding protein [Demequina sp. SYSU T0a273]